MRFVICVMLIIVFIIVSIAGFFICKINLAGSNFSSSRTSQSDLRPIETESGVFNPDSSLNYERLIDRIGYYKIGSRGSFITIFKTENGFVNAEHKTIHPRESKSSECSVIKLLPVNSAIEWKVYIVNDSLLWIKTDLYLIKWYHDGFYSGHIYYPLKESKWKTKISNHIRSSLGL